MRRLFIIGLTAFALFGFAEGATRVLAGRLGPAPEWPTLEMNIKSQQISELDSVDVLFLGSSLASFGIDPSVVTAAAPHIESSYDAAIPIAPLDVQRLWFEAVISGRLSSDLVVLELSPTVLLYRASPDDVDRIATSTPYLRGIGATRNPLASSDLVRYGPILRDPITVLARILEVRPRIILADGQSRWCAAFKIDPGLRARIVDGFTESSGDADFVARDSLELLLDSLSSQTVIVLVFPMEEAFFDADPAIRPKWEMELAVALDLARQRGIKVIDSTTLEWPQSLFSDPLHLNPAGAERLSEFVAAELEGMVTGQPVEFVDRTYDPKDCRER